MLSKEIKNKYILNIAIILSFLICSILSVILLYHTHILFGASDISFHARRINELKNSILNGNILPRFSFNEFNGSAVMTMYPYINLLPEVLLSFIIKSGIKLLYLSFIINIFISFIISYYSSYSYNHYRLVSYFFSLFYCTSTLYLDYGFLNMDLGMLSVIIALPLVMFGFLNLLKKYDWIELSIGMSIVTFSHVLSIFILSAFLLFWLLINFKRINKFLVKNICKASIITILVTSIFWIPFLHFFVLNIGNINRPSADKLFGANLFTMIYGAIKGQGTYNISIVPIIGIIISFILIKHLTKWEKQMLFLSILIIFICSNIFPWSITTHGILRIFEVFQFTWRFYVIPQIFLCYLASVCLMKMCKVNNKFFKITIIGISIILPLSYQMISQISIINNNINSHDLTNTFLDNHTTSRNKPQRAHHKLVYYNTVILPHPHNIKRPPLYKVEDQSQYDNLISPFNTLGGTDYYPLNVSMNSSKINSVVNNYAMSGPHHIKIKHIGYNKIYFKNNSSKTKWTLPIVLYNDEDLSIHVNNKIETPINRKAGMVEINHVRKGENYILIQVNHNYFEYILEILMTLMGLLSYIYVLFKKYIFKY